MKATIPSLQEITEFKIATSMWNESDILHDVFVGSSWLLIENKVKANVQELELPPFLRKRVSDTIQPLGCQIASWLNFRFRGIRSSKFPHMFFWKTLGIIDKQKTVMVFLQNKEIDVIDRYMLACFFCLERVIRYLWDTIDKDNSYKLANKLITCPIVRFWTLQMNSNLTWLESFELRKKFLEDSSCVFVVKMALDWRILAAVEYFWPKLTTQEKTKSVSKFLSEISGYISPPSNYDTYTDVLHYLLFSMDKQNQTEVLRKNSYYILCRFLIWPWKDVFFELASSCLYLLSEKEFVQLLQEILSYNKSSYSIRKYYNDLFEQLWIKSPISFRRFMVDADFSGIFMHLERNDDAKITLLLKDVTPEEKNKIIFSRRGMYACRILCYLKRWKLFERFVGECLLSAQSIVNFKEEFANYIMSGEFGRKKEFKIGKRQEEQEEFQILGSLLKKSLNEEDSCGESERCGVLIDV